MLNIFGLKKNLETIKEMSSNVSGKRKRELVKVAGEFDAYCRELEQKLASLNEEGQAIQTKTEALKRFIEHSEHSESYTNKPMLRAILGF